MSSVSTTNATITAAGVVQYEYDGVLRAQPGSEVPAETITGLLSNEQIAELEAAKLTGTISEVQIANGAISTPKLASGAVVTAKLAAGAVTAEKLAVVELSAITANLGSITSGTITGATIRTAAANPRVQLNSAGLSVIEAAGTVALTLSGSEGLVLTGGSGSGGSAPRRIEWHQADGGWGQLYAWSNNSSSSSMVSEVLTAKAGMTVTNVLSSRWTGKPEATARVQAITSSALSEIFIGASGEGVEVLEDVLLWNAKQQSHFLQLTGAAAKRKINFGSTTIRWAGSKSETEIKEVAHGLGSAALMALGGAQTTNTFFVTAEPSGTEKVKLQGYAPGASPPAGTERTIYWIAIG